MPSTVLFYVFTHGFYAILGCRYDYPMLQMRKMKHRNLPSIPYSLYFVKRKYGLSPLTAQNQAFMSFCFCYEKGSLLRN